MTRRQASQRKLKFLLLKARVSPTKELVVYETKVAANFHNFLKSKNHQQIK
jgi:hypothetical protein